MTAWEHVADAQVMQPAGRALLRVRGLEIAVFSHDSGLFAVEDGCPHNGASLCGGRLEQGHVRCPAHGLRFRLADGGLAGSAAGQPHGAMAVRVFPVRIEQGSIQLQLPDAPAC